MFFSLYVYNFAAAPPSVCGRAIFSAPRDVIYERARAGSPELRCSDKFIVWMKRVHRSHRAQTEATAPHPHALHRDPTPALQRALDSPKWDISGCEAYTLDPFHKYATARPLSGVLEINAHIVMHRLKQLEHV